MKTKKEKRAYSPETVVALVAGWFLFLFVLKPMIDEQLYKTLNRNAKANEQALYEKALKQARKRVNSEK